MEANYHQVVGEMYARVFKIWKKLTDEIQNINCDRMDLEADSPEELRLAEIENALQDLADEIIKDISNYKPVDYPSEGVVTTANGIAYGK